MTNTASNLNLPWKTAIIVAIDIAGGFSKDNQIPWHFPEDFQWFREVTDGNICVMGRATYDGIMQIRETRGLDVTDALIPRRTCYVLTSTDLPYPNATRLGAISDLSHMLTNHNQACTVFFIGGQRVFEETIDCVNEVFVTLIGEDYECDRFFPIDKLNDFSALHQYNATTFNGMFFHAIRKY